MIWSSKPSTPNCDASSGCNFAISSTNKRAFWLLFLTHSATTGGAGLAGGSDRAGETRISVKRAVIRRRAVSQRGIFMGFHHSLGLKLGRNPTTSPGPHRESSGERTPSAFDRSHSTNSTFPSLY